MRTILELEVTPKQEELLIDMLKAMNITFSSNHVEDEVSFEKGEKESDIKEAINNTFGIWKDRTEWKDFGDYRKQAWGGRGVK
ncbi:MAG: hypothetical protein ACOVO2_04325 [Emticicia sp.]|uniref:hypothetical protein n=1 Tax=Emticicia sp. TaxID=1930953 RepID=UPI003BA495D3